MAQETSPQLQVQSQALAAPGNSPGAPQLSRAQSGMHFNLATGGSSRSVPEGISLLSSYRPWPHWLQLIGMARGPVSAGPVYPVAIPSHPLYQIILQKEPVCFGFTWGGGR